MRIKSILAKDPGQNPQASRLYTYSPAGNIIQKETEHGTYSYTYDEMYRLTNAVNPTLDNETYTYDHLGNRLSAVGVPGEWTYNLNNEILSYHTYTFGHDSNGNLIEKANDSDVIFYTYDVEDRLIKVERSQAGEINTISEYYYDPFGRRLWKEVDGARTYFVYSDEGLVGEYDETGAELRTYGYSPGSQWSTDPLFVNIDGQYHWYRNDALGPPQKIIDTSGAVVWSATYDSFGNCRIDPETISNNLRFAGQYYDAETGLHYNLNRYYDPKTGRYLRNDPLGDGINLYAYAFNNPNAWLDPVGLCAVKKAWQKWTDFWTSDPEFLVPAIYDRAVSYGKNKIDQFIMEVPIESFGFNLGFGGTVKINGRPVKFGEGIAWIVDDKKMYLIPTVEVGAGFCPGKYSVSFFLNSVVGSRAKGSDYRKFSAAASGTVGPVSWAASAPIQSEGIGDKVFLEIGLAFKRYGGEIEGGFGVQYGLKGYEFENPLSATGEWWGNWLYERTHNYSESR